MLQDLRIAVRALLKAPLFAITVVVVLAFGIGANTAVFSAVNQLLLHPPGIRNPEQVVALRVKYEKMNLPNISVSVPDFTDFEKSTQAFEHAAIENQVDCNYSSASGSPPERLRCAEVSQDWFEVFGVKPSSGRTFDAGENRPNSNLVAILSDSAQRRIFSGESGLGKTIELNRKNYRVVGVMPPDFRWPRQVDIWTPLGLPQSATSEDNRFNESYFGVGRLRPGLSVTQANAIAAVLSDRVRSGSQNASFAKSSGWGMFVVPLVDFSAGDNKRPVLILLAAVGLVLLIACSNIAGLILARNTGRARDIAIRSAMGAGRWQILRQSLAESMWLAVLGFVVGLALASAALRVLLSFAPEDTVAGLGTSFDWRVLLFTASITIVCGLLFTLGSAWAITRVNAYEILKSAGRSGMNDRARRQARGALVVAETALALVLLAGAGLFLRSLANLATVQPGFNPEGVMTSMLSLPTTAYPKDENRIEFFRAVTERLKNSPGVIAAAAVIPLPFSGSAPSASFAIEGRVAGPGDPGPHGNIGAATSGYLAVMGIPLKRGRFFTDADNSSAPPVAVIDENLARQYWPNEDPIGRRITNGDPKKGPWSTIVGVVGHIRNSNLAFDSGKGIYYYPMLQQVVPYGALIVKTPAGAPGVASLIQRAVTEIDSSEPVHSVMPLGDLVAESLAARRFVVNLLAVFAVAALLMAALGLYGVIGYSVAQRTQEIGIRMALGAQTTAVLRNVLGEGLILSAFGAALGLAAALWAGQWLQGQLFEVKPFDPLTFAVSTSIVLAASLFACYLPARRATRVDPMVALRNE